MPAGFCGAGVLRERKLAGGVDGGFLEVLLAESNLPCPGYISTCLLKGLSCWLVSKSGGLSTAL